VFLSFSVEKLHRVRIVTRCQAASAQQESSAAVGETAVGGRRVLDVPVDDVDLYSSGEESLDKWTVETWRLYEITRNVDTDVLFTRRRQIRAAAAAAAAASTVDTSHGT